MTWHFQVCGQMANGTQGRCMAKGKKTKPREHLVRWHASLITKTR
jgi:hypothetical protein